MLVVLVVVVIVSSLCAVPNITPTGIAAAARTATTTMIPRVIFAGVVSMKAPLKAGTKKKL